MKKLNVLNKILKITGVNKIFCGFCITFMIISFLICLVEPNINTIGDAMWFCYVSLTTIGYGDFQAVTFMGRILIVLITVYGILVVALTTGVVVSFYNEMIKIKTKDTLLMFMDKLEQLPQLSKEDLEELANLIKDKRLNL